MWGQGSATAGAIITDRSASPDFQVKVGQILESGFLHQHQSVAMGRSGYPGPKLPQDLLDKVQCMFANLTAQQIHTDPRSWWRIKAWPWPAYEEGQKERRAAGKERRRQGSFRAAKGEGDRSCCCCIRKGRA